MANLSHILWLVAIEQHTKMLWLTPRVNNSRGESVPIDSRECIRDRKQRVFTCSIHAPAGQLQILLGFLKL